MSVRLAPDRRGARLHALGGFEPIVDFVHHTSYPAWLTGSFTDPRFPGAYQQFCDAFARRYPWIREYTLFNEPFATLFLSGHEAIWPPYRHGMDGLVAVLRNVLPAIASVSRGFREFVVSSFGEVVDLRGDAEGFAEACRDVLGHSLEERDRQLAPLLHERRWDTIAARMGRLMARAQADRVQGEGSSPWIGVGAGD